MASNIRFCRGGFLYRKERKKRMRRKLSDRIDNILGEKIRSGSSDSCSGGERHDNDEFETDYYSSSIESTHEDDKVVLQIGSTLKKILETDYHFVKSHKLTILPAKLPVWQILENFVRHYTIKSICGPQPQRRRRNSHAVRENKVKEHERMQNW
jgi:male-specific lethal 3